MEAANKVISLFGPAKLVFGFFLLELQKKVLFFIVVRSLTPRIPSLKNKNKFDINATNSFLSCVFFVCRNQNVTNIKVNFKILYLWQ